MAVTFDGDALVITLESGITDVDVFEDVYEDAKDWFRAASNRKYPFPFVSDGGNPLTSIINQGGYIFLRNDLGWRIKPPEEDITIYLTGNLAVSTTDLPAFVPTNGDFTAAIIGLQPVTQGVTPVMAAQLEFGSFAGGVWVDENSTNSGTGLTAEGEPIGNAANPVNNVMDATTIATQRGLPETLYFKRNYTLGAGENVSDFRLVGQNTARSLLTLGAAATITNVEVRDATVTGTLDGEGIITNSFVYDLSYVSGYITSCQISGTITLGGGAQANILNCHSGVAGTSTPTINCGGSGQSLYLSGYDGGVLLTNKTGTDAVTINLEAGQVKIDLTTVTNGTIVVRGNGKVVDAADEDDYLLSGTYGSMTLVNETDTGRMTQELWLDRGLDVDNPVTVNESAGTVTVAGIVRSWAGTVIKTFTRS